MSDIQGLLPYATTERQVEVLKTLIETGSPTKAGLILGIKKQSVQYVVKVVRQRAATRGHAPEADMTRPTAEGFAIKRVSTNVDGDGRINQQWVIQEQDKAAMAAAICEAITGMCAEIPRAKPVKAPTNLSELLASAIIFGDAHIGMLAHAIETLDEDYDLESATRDLRAAIDYCIDAAPASEQGWFVNVGDFLHVDNSKNTTTGGTPQDTSVNVNVAFRAAGAVIRYAIDSMLKKFGKVVVVNARGNHDGCMAFALNEMIRVAYEDEERVEVLDNGSKFQFIEFGQCLIGINHGDKINQQRLVGAMTKNMAEAWGRTTFRRWWIGHIHHKDKKETDFGCTVESFNSLAALDAWHSSCGYGAERRVTLITLHRDFGEVMRMEPSLEMIRAFAA